MKVGFIGGLAMVAGLVLVAGVAGVLVVKYTSSGSGTRTQSESTENTPAPTPSQQAAAPAPGAETSRPENVPAPAVAVTTDPKTGKAKFARSCAGVYVEAVSMGVLPNFAQLTADPPQPGKQDEMVCSATTPAAHYQIAYFSSCAGGGDDCKVLAHVTQEGKYVIYHRD